jgi:hypothetical protein
MYNQAEVQAYEGPVPERPMGLIEAIVLFGVLAVVFDGIGAVIGRLVGLDLPLCACLNVFLYVGAGFVAARHSTIANGIWAGIGAVSIDTVLGQLLLLAILPTYQTMLTNQFKQASGGVLIALTVGTIVVTVIVALIIGALFGAIGAAISHAGPFRPRYYWD